jgi:hypothetical protein
MSGIARVSPSVVAIAVALLASACAAGVVATNPTTPSSSVPTAAASAAPIATPAAPPSPTSAPTLPPSGQLTPGTYRSDFITYTLPAGWSAYQSWGANKNDGNPPNGRFIAPWRSIATVYNDPCHWQTTGASVGATVADEVAALLAQKRGRSTVTPIDVMVDGFRGKQVDLMVPLGADFAACDDATYKSFTDASGGDRSNQGPGQHDLLDILDVSGQTLVIDRVFYPANTAADLAELQAIFDSIKITP